MRSLNLTDELIERIDAAGIVTWQRAIGIATALIVERHVNQDAEWTIARMVSARQLARQGERIVVN